MGTLTVGVALGSGGAKGFAHIGVLKALEEKGVPVHVVAGSSMGSLIGAFYATGMTPSFMERFACTVRWRHWVDFTMSKLGLIAGDKVHHMVALLTRGLRIEDAERPLAIVATELLERRKVTFLSGPIADAVRASISIPGVFMPYAFGGGIYVDGGVVERVPMEAARMLGANLVIAVDVAVTRQTSPPETMMDVIMQSLDIMQDVAYAKRDRFADIYIQPDLSGVGASHFHKAKVAIDAGYEAAMSVMDRILDRLEQHRAESL